MEFNNKKDFMTNHVGFQVLKSKWLDILRHQKLTLTLTSKFDL